MYNVLSIFRSLIPASVSMVGTVDSLLVTGKYRVVLPDGSEVHARGTADVGDLVFVRDGVIESTAPAVPIDIVEI